MNSKTQQHQSILSAWRQPRFDACGFDPLTGARLEPLDPWFCYVEGDPSDDPPDDPPKGKMFSQEDVDRMIKKRLSTAEKSNAALTKKLEAAAKSSEDTAAKLDALQEKFDATNKSDVEKELAKLQRTVSKMEDANATAVKERDEAVAQAAEAKAGLTQTKLRGQLREALRANQAHGKGMGQAVDLMLTDGAGFDEDGNFAMKVGEVPFDKPEEAAKKWLETNTHFLEGTGGGSGTPRPGGNGKLLSEKVMDEMSDAALISEGLTIPVKTG